MKNPFYALFRAQNKPQNIVGATPTFYFSTNGFSQAINASTAIQFSTVCACVRLIPETVTSLPLKVHNKR